MAGMQEKWRDCSDRPIARRPASTSCIPADPLVQGICDAAVLVMLGAGSLAGQLPQAASPQPSCSDDSRYMHWLGLCGVARRPASTSCIPAAPLFRGLATWHGRAGRCWGMEGPGGAGAGRKADTVCWGAYEFGGARAVQHAHVCGRALGWAGRLNFKIEYSRLNFQVECLD